MRSLQVAAGASDALSRRGFEEDERLEDDKRGASRGPPKADRNAPAGRFEGDRLELGGAVLTSVSCFGNSAALFDLTDVPNQPGLFSAGIQSHDLPFGCGRRSVGGMTLRGAVIVPSSNQALAVPFEMSPANALDIQCWYHDHAHLTLCGSAFNPSNALKR